MLCFVLALIVVTVNNTDDENEFDQWDSSWYWDNGFADLSMSQSGKLAAFRLSVEFVARYSNTPDNLYVNL